MKDLGSLFKIARMYGRVNLFTQDNGQYSATIKFDTNRHVQLDASSGFNNSTPEEAVERAIKTAQNIVDDINKLSGHINHDEIKLLK